MLVEGFDVTSRPTKAKPLTRCLAELDGAAFRVIELEDLPTVESFLESLRSPEPRRMGIDSPLGMPKPFWNWLGFSDWSSGVRSLGTREEWVEECRKYRGPKGEKELFRPCDRLSRAASPMKTFYVPVARMFHLVAPALEATDISVLPHRPTQSKVEAVEAYPTISVLALTGNRSYKSDTKDTPEKRANRSAAVKKLREAGLYGFRVEGLPEGIEEDSKSDVLDAVLCALQAAKSLKDPIPADVDPVEGWIAGLEVRSADGHG